MFMSQPLRHQHLERLGQQLFAPVAKQFLHLGVDQNNPALAIDNHNRVGRRFQQSAEFAFRALPLGDINSRRDDVGGGIAAPGRTVVDHAIVLWRPSRLTQLVSYSCGLWSVRAVCTEALKRSTSSGSRNKSQMNFP